MDSVIKTIESQNLGDVAKLTSLSAISKWRTGGAAKLVVQPNSIESMLKIVRLLNNIGEGFIIVGATSNLLFADEGLDVVLIKINSRMGDVCRKGNVIYAEAGVYVPSFARAVAKEGFSGVEHVVGIPASLGGLINMNGGSLRQSIGSNILRVLISDYSGNLRWLDKSECGFGYRKSVFQNGELIVLAAEFSFHIESSYVEIRKKMLDVIRARRKKFPLRYPNCGSVFSSPPEMFDSVGPAGSLIEKVGLKGMARNGAEISELHGNFIINKGTASSADILYLIKYARDRVLDVVGYKMETEVCYVESDGAIKPVHQYLDESNIFRC